MSWEDDCRHESEGFDELVNLIDSMGRVSRDN